MWEGWDRGKDRIYFWDFTDWCARGMQQQSQSAAGPADVPCVQQGALFAAYQSVPDVLSLVIDTRAPEVAPMS